jgi:hypothetical protein
LPTPAALAIVAVAGLLVLVFSRRARLLRRRRRQWEAVAPELGYTIVSGVDLTSRFQGLPLFTRGHHRRSRIVLEGRQGGCAAILADYQYTTGGGQSQRVHRQTVCIFQDETLGLPGFLLRRERGLVDRIGEWLGMQDIDFADDPAFSHAFVLKGSDETQVRELFRLERRQRLLQSLPPRLHLEGDGNLLLIDNGRLLAPIEARDFVVRATEVLDTFRR